MIPRESTSLGLPQDRAFKRFEYNRTRVNVQHMENWTQITCNEILLREANETIKRNSP